MALLLEEEFVASQLPKKTRVDSTFTQDPNSRESQSLVLLQNHFKFNLSPKKAFVIAQAVEIVDRKTARTSHQCPSHCITRIPFKQNLLQLTTNQSPV